MTGRRLLCAMAIGLVAAASGCTDDEADHGGLTPGPGPYALVDDLCQRLNGSELGTTSDADVRIVDAESDDERVVQCKLEGDAVKGVSLSLAVTFYEDMDAALVAAGSLGGTDYEWYAERFDNVQEIAGWDDGVTGTDDEITPWRRHMLLRAGNVVIQIAYWADERWVVVDDPETVMFDAALDLAEQVRQVIGSAD